MKRPTEAETRALLMKVTHTRVKLSTAHADYVAAIVTAAHAGVVYERIAHEAGITRSRVGQLAATHHGSDQ